MGGNRFFTRAAGYNMQEAYKNACEEAESEYGHQQGYSGEINVTGGFIDKTKEYKNSKHKTIQSFIDSLENDLTKGNAYGICEREPALNQNKIKTIVEDKVLKGTRVWQMYYVVYSHSSDNEIGKALLKADAVKIARAYTEKTKARSYVIVEKRSVQNATVAEIKYKSGPNEAKGEYVFFGIASC